MAGEDGDSIVSVIVRRNLQHGLTQGQVTQAFPHLHTVRLDREGMTVLKDLEVVKQVQNLYLQENLIKKIENVDVLKDLRFLSLSWNRLEEIQKLRSLTNLQYLDLSHNLIKKLDANELPPSLLILDLTGNPCTKAKDYRQQVLDALPLLQQLDGESVRDSANENSLSDNEEEDGSSSDDSNETSLSFDDSGGLSSVSHEMIQRSFERRNRALKEHEERLAELNDTLDKESLRNDIGSVVLQECSASSTKTHNSIISEQKLQHSASIKKQLKEQQNKSSFMSASKPIPKNQVSVSSCQSEPGKANIGLSRTSAKKLVPQSKIDPAPTGKTYSTGTAAQKDRKITSAPSTKRMSAVPTKNTLLSSEKTSARSSPTTATARAPHERQTTSAPTKKTLPSPEKTPLTRLRVSSNAQSTTKKP
ncbi:hypothetical protein GDO81_013123 [Engystomops pustulosus]|uniref:Leucine-rich repeat-containing protein 46 n=1 Tax=Engystomops pustulosus TaxID=76066 RepID=A0AAV7B2Z3_ENGPU|nr:hypothetical protein GDO81_013123 [Engystomops pustulosus]